MKRHVLLMVMAVAVATSICTNYSNDSENHPGVLDSVRKSVSDPLNLEEQICNDDILTYELDDGTIRKSTVQNFEVLSSRTTEDYDTSEVKVVLMDDMLERTLFISVDSTKYQQGWMVDSIDVTDFSFKLVGDIDQDFIAAYLSEDRMANYGQGNFTNYRTLNGVEAGLHNLTMTDKEIQDNAFFATYEVNDSHQYADFKGTVYVRVDLTMDVKYYSGACHVRRKITADTEAITTAWHDIFGTYKLSVPYSSNQIEQYINVDRGDEVKGYRNYVGANDGQLYYEDLFGKYDEVNYSTAIVHVVNSWSYSEYIIFTPDNIKYRYLKPNGSDFDDGANYNKVFFEKLS